MEIEIATAVGIPVVYLIKKGSRLSRMVEGNPGKKRIIEYADSTELVEKLSPVLAELEPRLLERRRKYLNHDKNLLASRLRDLRERSGFSLAHLGTLTDLTVEQLESFERDDVRVSLITVEQLRTISEALGVPGSYLLGEMQYLKDLVAYRNLDSLRCYARTHNLRYPVYEELWSEYQDSRNQIGFAVKTRDTTVLTEEDWGKRHEAFVDRGRQRTLDLIP
jgi:transcriptional regulator with XRE-family HTH domain